jgi:ferric-dicitrate binding protein FerR (iron transport regulator)
LEPSLLAELFRKYINNTCTPEEVDQLMVFLEKENASPDRDGLLRGPLLEGLEPAGYSDPVLQQQLENRLQHILQHITPQELPKARVVSLSRRRVAAAAAIVLLLLGGALYYWFNRPVQTPVIARSAKPADDVAPGGNKAVLTLGNGRRVALDTAVNGEVAIEGSSAINKQDGQLLYKAGSGDRVVPVYNTMTTPNGGQYRLRLSDGTMVWLNAASSIHYPTVFSGRERKVSITGEAYFEVAKNAAMPFIVQVDDREQVEVLGTHFNINAYDDEPSLNTTLLEGRVSITRPANNGQRPTILSPGQQSQLATGTEHFQLSASVDTAQVMAWKNNLFRFDSADLKKVMRQLARWYNVEVVFEKDAPVSEVFFGEMQRSLNLSQVLNGLGGMGVNFRIEGRKLMVTR